MPGMYVGQVRQGRGLGVERMADMSIFNDIAQRFGMTFVPGTLNIVLAQAFERPINTVFVPSVELSPEWEEMTGQAGYHLTPVFIEDQYRGLAMQAEEDGYPPEQIEMMCEVHLRTSLGLDDGDEVRFSAANLPRP